VPGYRVLVAVSSLQSAARASGGSLGQADPEARPRQSGRWASSLYVVRPFNVRSGVCQSRGGT